MQRLFHGIVTLAAVAIVALLCAIMLRPSPGTALPALTTPYHAVALANGQVFFGRVDESASASSAYTVLDDVFYVQTRRNTDSGQVSNVLIKRGAEAHGPDRMLIGRGQIVLIEPVTANSQIATLIAEQKARR